MKATHPSCRSCASPPAPIQSVRPVVATARTKLSSKLEFVVVSVAHSPFDKRASPPP
ncbi:hypothetical protein [Polyangium mundeleinium]|uniref:Uncharacterized protein n=1 Tax=Polyangium mundeleinium TaxID=2995306 RepID=A0ABT5EK00_9BACT|nr:hypothetical protein [Polyangium mundeleinium]MDC0741659.1 hypothetical protein [Polyangium mundeleinium]